MAAGTPAAAEPLRVFAAGSLSGALQELIAASGLPSAAVAPLTFGPAGLLRQRIEAGEVASVFLSADLAQPQRLASGRPGALVVPFARNRMCVVATRPVPEATPALLEWLLAPGVRLGVSTAGVDPGGDYARAVFARAGAERGGRVALLLQRRERGGARGAWLMVQPLPPDLEVHPVYALTILAPDPRADRLAVFLVSEPGQAILVRHGLLPLTGR